MPNKDKTKTKPKSNHSESSNSSTENVKKSCYKDQSNDLSTPQYQRLSRLLLLLSVPNNFAEEYTCQVPPHNRNGLEIPTPDDSIGVTGCGTPKTGAYYNENYGDEIVPVSFTAVDGIYEPSVCHKNAFSAYFWVNTLRYLSFEPSCQNDQVWGWYVDLQDGNLQLFQETDGVPTNIIRLYTLTANSSSSVSLKRQAKILNNLYKLSYKAIKSIEGIPKEEGNIVKITDKCDQKWLLAVNFVNTSHGSVFGVGGTNNSAYIIVATKL